MNRFYAVLLLSVTSMAATPAEASKISSLQQLGHAIQNAVLCQQPVDARDKPVLQELLRLGVQVDGADDDGPIGLTYKLPRGVQVFGYEAETVIYDGDSGSIFYARLKAAPAELESLKNKLGLVPIPKDHKEYSYADDQDAKYYRPTQASTQDNPYPDTIVAGLEHQGGVTYVYVGCRTFDG